MNNRDFKGMAKFQTKSLKLKWRWKKKINTNISIKYFKLFKI